MKQAPLRWSRWRRFRNCDPSYRECVLSRGRETVLTIYRINTLWMASYRDDGPIRLRAKDGEAAKREGVRWLQRETLRSVTRGETLLRALARLEADRA